MAYQPNLNDDDRICNWTFVKERDLPNGQQLQRCSKCKECFYVSREAQAAHWPYHKQSCVAIENDDKCILEPLEDYESAAQLIGWILHNPKRRIKGRLLLHALKEFRRYFATPGFYFGANDFVMQRIASVSFRFVLNPLKDLHARTSGQGIFFLLWSIPGFAATYLSNEVYLSPAMIERKRQGLEPPPKEEYHLEEALPKEASRYDFAWQVPLGYCSFLTGLFQNTASEVKSGVTPMPEHLVSLAAAIIRVNMESWSDPFVRVSYPANYQTGPDWSDRSDTFFWYWHLGAQAEERRFIPKLYQEVAPGLTFYQMLKNLMEDQPYLYGLHESHFENQILFFLVKRTTRPGDNT